MMDVSKLPRLSETKPVQGSPENAPVPAPAEAPPAGPRLSTLETPRAGAEAWISIAIGLILIFMCPRPLQYLFTRGHPETFTWTFTDANGDPMDYTRTAFFLPDVGVVAFGFILMLDGLLLVFARSRSFVWVTLGLTFIVTALNLLALVTSMNQIGFQILPALAIAFGVYMMAFQWRLVQVHRAAAA